MLAGRRACRGTQSAGDRLIILEFLFGVAGETQQAGQPYHPPLNGRPRIMVDEAVTILIRRAAANPR
jgi:hypothetical protein